MTRKTASIEYRKGLKGKILDTALIMFRQHGLRAVKMDDISQALGISKRTLYEIYPNKEDLIFESLKTGIENSRKTLTERISESSDTMDILIEFFKIRIEEYRSTNYALLDDLQQYPRIKEFFERNKIEHAENVLQFFTKGQDEGYFIKNINIMLVREITKAISEFFISSRLYMKYDSDEVLIAFTHLFVRSLCTERGIKRIDEVLQTF